MDCIVTRLLERGRLVRNKHIVIAREVRGRLSIRQQQARGRWCLVAHLAPQARDAVPPPPLHDVTLLPSIGEVLTLTGMEMERAGPLQDEHWHAQTWHVRAGPVEDLHDMEARLSRLAFELDELKREP
jgi:hypothetical protein